MDGKTIAALILVAVVIVGFVIMQVKNRKNN